MMLTGDLMNCHKLGDTWENGKNKEERNHRLLTDFATIHLSYRTYNEPNDHLNEEPHIAHQLHIEEGFMRLAIGLDPAVLSASIVPQQLLFNEVIQAARVDASFQSLAMLLLEEITLYCGYRRRMGSTQIAATVAGVVGNTKCWPNAAARWSYTMLMILLLGRRLLRWLLADRRG